MNSKKLITIEQEEEVKNKLVAIATEYGLTQSLWQSLAGKVVREMQWNATLPKEYIAERKERQK